MPNKKEITNLIESLEAIISKNNFIKLTPGGQIIIIDKQKNPFYFLVLNQEDLQKTTQKQITKLFSNNATKMIRSGIIQINNPQRTPLVESTIFRNASNSEQTNLDSTIYHDKTFETNVADRFSLNQQSAILEYYDGKIYTLGTKRIKKHKSIDYRDDLVIIEYKINIDKAKIKFYRRSFTKLITLLPLKNKAKKRKLISSIGESGLNLVEEIIEPNKTTQGYIIPKYDPSIVNETLHQEFHGKSFMEFNNLKEPMLTLQAAYTIAKQAYETYFKGTISIVKELSKAPNKYNQFEKEVNSLFEEGKLPNISEKLSLLSPKEYGNAKQDYLVYVQNTIESHILSYISFKKEELSQKPIITNLKNPNTEIFNELNLLTERDEIIRKKNSFVIQNNF